MCRSDHQLPRAPATAAQALAAVRAGLDYLANADVAGLTCSEQADCLRGLAAAESAHLAVTARVLAAFNTAGGHAADGQITPKSWLRWQTRVTGAAAGAAVAWMRRLAAHPDLAAALAAGRISPSYAREICDWSDRLPEDKRAQADRFLLGAAAEGADLADLSVLAEEIQRQCARPDADGDDGFADRKLRLTPHYRGHARLDGDLTPAAAAALRAVLDSLDGKTGPEDERTQAQRDHDALEEACRRLVAAGLPDRAGQATQIQLQMTLSQLLGQPEAEPAIAAWAAANGAAAPPGADCDAVIVPIVTGTLDPDVLAQAAAAFAGADTAGVDTAGVDTAGVDTAGVDTRGMAERAARLLAVSQAVRLLSGPAGLAAWLRTSTLSGLAASISLPLDIGAATDTIPAHLRRIIARRDQHCRFPGCQQRPAACHVHHLIPRTDGGATSLDNCCLLCPFHHLIAIHRWGWTLVVNPDGTTTATDPRGWRILHSHAAPAAA